ncbi:MAG: butyrate kinase [Saccharofermentanales bacterium]
MKNFQILVINTGSTSTKIALYENDQKLWNENMVLPEEIQRTSLSAIDQLPYRTEVLQNFLEKKGIDIKGLDIVVARGGPLPPINGGAYAINQLMVDVLTYDPPVPHESSLSCMLARLITQGTDVPAIIYDGESLDEMIPAATVTGCPPIRNNPRGHPLNARKVARKAADELAMPYEEGKFIVAHFGGSISVSAHKFGRIIDIANAYTGPMSVQRAGRLPTDELVALCFSGEFNKREMLRKLNGASGFMAYFGTQDAREVFQMARNNDEKANLMIEAMVLQCSKSIAEMRMTINEDVDRIVFTGGMAYNAVFTDMISQRVEFIAPVMIFPGEYEMDALAEGALLVLNNEIPVQNYDVVFSRFRDSEDFYSYVKKTTEK